MEIEGEERSDRHGTAENPKKFPLTLDAKTQKKKGSSEDLAEAPSWGGLRVLGVGGPIARPLRGEKGTCREVWRIRVARLNSGGRPVCDWGGGVGEGGNQAFDSPVRKRVEFYNDGPAGADDWLG